ncbi:MAG: hypothetical protein JSS62_04025 [Verrucomicrobia bacterium]|nr:hypothetical protein [Verrucomicrobiota bacterium]MBS0647061.1 hypothetical protein [Verrucomicrobiota bacterium]
MRCYSVLLAAFCCTSFKLLALPVLNPWEYALTQQPSILPILDEHPSWSFKAGFLGDYVLNRKLEVASSSADIQFSYLRTHQGLLSFAYRKKLEIYVGLGASKLAIETPASAFGYQFTGAYNLAFAAASFGNNFPFFDPNSFMSFTSNAAFSYTLGGSCIVWDTCKYALSLAGRYFYTHAPITNVFLPFSVQNNRIYNVAGGMGAYAPQVAPSTVYLQNVACSYREWQVDLCLSYILKIAKTLKALPFLALNCSGVYANFGDAVVSSTPPLPPASPLLVPGQPNSVLFTPVPFAATLYNLRQQTLFGGTLGSSFIGNSCFAAGIEWRFWNENAFCLDFNINF